MEEQMQRPTHGHHHYEEDTHNPGLHSVIEGEGEHIHNHPEEKKSVLKKVKDKAKKIRETIKNHGHDHNISEEEEDEEDEEMVNDPEIHGASMYESAVIPGTNLPIQTGINLEKPTDTREDRYDPNVGGGTSPGKMETDLGRPLVEAREPELENSPRSSPNTMDVEEANVGEPMIEIGPLAGLEEDPHSSKNHPVEFSVSNYEAKVTDPTGEGGEEAEVAPLVQRLGYLHVGLGNLPVKYVHETIPGPEEKSYTGSHDQFAPQPTPTEDQFNPESNPVNPSENPEMPKGLDSSKPESMPRDTIAGKISSATSVISDKAISAKNAVASKLGYGGQSQEGEDASKKSYGDIVVGKLAPVYGKVTGAGSAILSKVQRSGRAEDEGGDMAAKGTDRGVSMKEYFAGKLRPGDEDKALSEAITEALYKRKARMARTVEEQSKTSEDVAARALAEGGKDEMPAAGGGEKSGGGAMNRLKGTVSSWFGKSSGTTQHSGAGGGVGQSKEEVGIIQQPRLQESGN